MRGAVELAFAGDGSTTRLQTLYHKAPLRALFPTPAAGDPVTAVIATTSGGLVGGDRLSLNLAVSAGGQALVTTQAAEKIYRSLGPDCAVDVSIEISDAAALEWMPQETILFDRARLRRTTTVALDGDSRLLAGDILVFGRTAHGESLHAGLVRDTWEVRVDGRLVWADALHMADDLAGLLAHPACFDGARAYATLLYAAPDAPERLPLARDLLPADAVASGATVVGPLLIARFLARDTLQLRGAFCLFWAKFRAAVLGRPARLPRVWQI